MAAIPVTVTVASTTEVWIARAISPFPSGLAAGSARGVGWRDDLDLPHTVRSGRLRPRASGAMPSESPLRWEPLLRESFVARRRPNGCEAVLARIDELRDEHGLLRKLALQFSLSGFPQDLLNPSMGIRGHFGSQL